MSQIDSRLLKVLIEGLESGRVTEAGAWRFVNEPWLASSVFRGARPTLCPMPVSARLDSRLTRAAWVRTDSQGVRIVMVWGSEQGDTASFELTERPCEIHLTENGLVWRDSNGVFLGHLNGDVTGHPAWLRLHSEATGMHIDAIVPLGEDDIALFCRGSSGSRLATSDSWIDMPDDTVKVRASVTTDGALHLFIGVYGDPGSGSQRMELWYSKGSDKFRRLARCGAQLFFDSYDNLVRVLPDGSLLSAVPCGKSGDPPRRFRDGEGVGMLGHGCRKPKSLNPLPWTLGDSTLVWTCDNCGSVLMDDGAAVRTVRVPTTVKDRSVKGIFGTSKRNQMFAIVRGESGKDLVETIDLEKGIHIVEEAPGSILTAAACRTAGKDDIALLMLGDDERIRVVRWSDRKRPIGMTRDLPTEAPQAALTVSPDGEHIAWVCRVEKRRRNESAEYLMVDGQAGPLHKAILKVIFATETRIRYLAKVGEGDRERLEVYEVELT